MRLRPNQVIGIFLILALVVTSVLLGMHRAHEPGKDKLEIVTTFYPLYDFSRQIGGDHVRVTNVTPPGAEPHDYEPTPRQLAAAQHADVFVFSGAGLEPWADSFLTGFRQTAVPASDSITLKSGAENPAGPVRDPHVWLDPVLAQAMVDTIRDGLVQADPKNAAYYKERASAYKARLADLDEAFRKGLGACQARTIVTAHAAFGYAAKRYNLEVATIAGLEPEEEPSAAKLAELARLVREKHISYIFFEALTSPQLAQTIARETGAQTDILDPIEGLSDEDQKQGKDYLSVQRENLAGIRRALACE